MVKRTYLFIALVFLACAGVVPAQEVAGAPAQGAGELTVAAEGHGAAGGAAGKAVQHGLSLDAKQIPGVPKWLPLTNSMVMVLLVAGGIILICQLATRNLKLVPSGLQNFVEWLIESLYAFLEGILGAHLVKRTFWFFATLFILILFTNWAGLVPGVGTVWGLDEAGHKVPLLRGGNADLNMTLAMAVIFFALWTYWALSENGLRGFLGHIFGAKGKFDGLMKVFMILIFLFVGVLEAISILFRPVSLSLRLFGNIFAGENILESMMHVVPNWLSWLPPLPFYFLELLVGLIQALVFTLLTAVFLRLICDHSEDHSEDHSKEGHAKPAH